MKNKIQLLKKMQIIAKKKNGKCLSKKYINTKIKLKWTCKNGHIWMSSPYNIINGCWCPYCALLNRWNNRRPTIHNMHVIAKKFNGVCLSNNYDGCHNKLTWKCKEGHIWDATPMHIKEGHWCPICGGSHKLSIKDMHILAIEKDGKCLSKKYINSHMKLKWRCKNKHTWMAAPTSIKTGTWCPYCSIYKNEQFCREYLEKKTGFKFTKYKSSWLGRLELDGYCKKLNIAFEYNGEQHYRQHKRFHKKYKDFLDQKNRDRRKTILCKQNNITLIKIPYKYNYYNPIKMRDFIDKKLRSIV
jgi:hypothetical protein